MISVVERIQGGLDGLGAKKAQKHSALVAKMQHKPDAVIASTEKATPKVLNGKDCVVLYPPDPSWDYVLFGREFTEMYQKIGPWKAVIAGFGCNHLGERVERASAWALAPKNAPLRLETQLSLPAEIEQLRYDLDRIRREDYYYEILDGLGLFSRDQVGLIICQPEAVFMVMNVKLGGVIMTQPVLIEAFGEKRKQILSSGQIMCYPPDCFIRNSDSR